jgi:FG-GAP repeat
MLRLPVILIAILATLGLAAPAAAVTVNVPRSASIVMRGEDRGDLAGASVARAGDVNGDGRGDVIVGAPLADPFGRRDAGAAYVVFGGGPRGRVDLGALGERGFRIAGAVPIPRERHLGRYADTSGAGKVVVGAGDVNADGLADVIVSGRFAAFASTAVFVIFGKPDTGTVDLNALGAGGYLVRAVGEVDLYAGAPAGDTNGDGRADTAIAVARSGDEDAGAVLLVPGKADAAPVVYDFETGTGPPGLIIGGRSSLVLGSALAPAGDVNRDGLGDLLIGAPGAGRRVREAGRGSVFVLFGTRTPPAFTVLRPRQPFAGVEVSGPRPREGFGYTLARFGSGFIAGAPRSPLRLPFRGRGGAWIVRSRDDARPIRLRGPRTGGPAGVAVDAPGDVAGDRVADALVVTHGRSRRLAKALLFSARGRLLTTFGGLRNAQEVRIAGAGAGDVVGNRRNDLMFGAPGANAAYVVASR